MYRCLLVFALSVVRVDTSALCDDSPPSPLVAPFDEEQAKSAQAESALRLKLDVVSTNTIDMQLTLIPAGEFQMGADESAEEFARKAGDRGPDYVESEHPSHAVRITQPFLLGVSEVTQAEWQSVMESTPSAFSSSGVFATQVADLDTSVLPVENVTWYSAIEFCNRLSEKEALEPYYELNSIERRRDGQIYEAQVTITGGSGYRLPTEAEWEYSCRAGTQTAFHFGQSSNGANANIDGRAPYPMGEPGVYRGLTSAVRTFAPNAFGLYDMHGNVSEWCFDCYGEDVYSERSGKTDDPLVTSCRVQEFVVVRGGSFHDKARNCRSGYRGHTSAFIGIFDRGFRVARMP